MSQTTRDEDLFAESTMSFGEHIEELRGALARALIGLAIGVGVAFFWADDAVRWIEKPLKDGLTQFNIKKATLNFDDQLSPEQLGLITDGRLAPTEISIEAELLMEQLRAAFPDQMPSIDTREYAFLASDLQQSLPKLVYPLADEPAIRLQLRFTRPAQADTALLSLQMRPAANQARGQVPQLRQLDLQFPLKAPRTLRKYIQYESGSV